MSELIPKFKVGQVVRAEWEGKSVTARIADVTDFERMGFIGYRTDTDQHFREEELSTDIRIGDIVKSEFNGIISLVTKTGAENANVVEVDCANNGSFRLLTDLEIKQLSQDEFMDFVCKDKYPNISFKVDEYVVASGIPFDRFKGIQKIKEVKEYNNELTYLIGNCWCCANDIKKWIPKVNDKVITTKILHKYNAYDENYIENEYNIIGTVIEVREKENSVILDDYSSALIKDLKPYIEGTK